MINSRYIDPIAEYVFSHYAKLFDDDSGLKSIVVRIANAKKQIDEFTMAFVEAKNTTLRNNIEAKIADLEKTIECLLKEKIKIERARKKRPTKQDALAIVKKYIEFNNFDKRFQKSMLDVVLKKVLCGDDGLVIYLNVVD